MIGVVCGGVSGKWLAPRHRPNRKRPWRCPYCRQLREPQDRWLLIEDTSDLDDSSMSYWCGPVVILVCGKCAVEKRKGKPTTE